MKSIIASLVLFSAFSAQAVTYDCFSLEEMGAVYNVTVGKARMTADMTGRRYEARSVKVTEYGKVVSVADGVGTATAKSLNLTLLEGGDMAMGSIKAKEYMPGRLSGKMQLAGRGVIEIGCKVKN